MLVTYAHKEFSNLVGRRKRVLPTKIRNLELRPYNGVN